MVEPSFLALTSTPSMAPSSREETCPVRTPSAARATPKLAAASARAAVVARKKRFIVILPRCDTTAWTRRTLRRKPSEGSPPSLASSLQRGEHPIGCHRGVPQAHAGELGDRVRDRGGHQGRCHLADTRRMVVGRNRSEERRV